MRISPPADAPTGRPTGPAQPPDDPSRRPPAGFYLHPSAALHDTGWNHPDHQGRLRSLASSVGRDMLALHGRVEQTEPPAAEIAWLARVHPQPYLARLREASVEAEVAGSIVRLDPETCVSAATWEALLGSSGAVCHAVDEVLAGRRHNAFVAARPPGHHASTERAMGFCMVNHVAVGARHALAQPGVERVAIIDWDLHHGNGTQEIFYHDPDVLYLSLHEWPQFPGTGASTETGEGPGRGRTINVPLPAGTRFTTYRRAFAEALERAPGGADLVLISAGYDTLRGDPLGSFELQPSDFHELTRMVLEWAGKPANGRVVAVLEGGYVPASTGRAVVATLRALAGVELDA